MVAASWPVSSASRLAARPVGAASTTFARLAFASSTTERTVKLLPHPGPPVSTATREVSASRTASACSGASVVAGPLAQPAERLVPVDGREARQPVRPRGEQPEEGSRHRSFRMIEGRQVDGGDRR